MRSASPPSGYSRVESVRHDEAAARLSALVAIHACRRSGGVPRGVHPAGGYHDGRLSGCDGAGAHGRAARHPPQGCRHRRRRSRSLRCRIVARRLSSRRRHRHDSRGAVPPRAAGHHRCRARVDDDCNGGTGGRARRACDRNAAGGRTSGDSAERFNGGGTSASNRHRPDPSHPAVDCEPQ